MSDAGRRRVAEEGLTPAAVAALTPLLLEVDVARLAEVKGLLKRFFSEQPWGPGDGEALADAVGAGQGEVRQELAPGLVLVAGWADGRFRVSVTDEGGGEAATAAAPDLEATFRLGVIPEATPNPRTLRFATARRPSAESRAYRRGSAADEARVDRLFAVSPEVADVLVGPDFVAVSVDRPRRWPELLEPVLEAVAAGFGAVEDDAPGPAPKGGPAGAGAAATAGGADSADGAGGAGGAGGPRRPATRFERAWAELGHLRPERPEDLAAILAAAGDEDAARRQVAATLLAEAPPEVAAETWTSLGRDPSRVVRRAAVDAVVDAGREELRPVLEAALGDADGWIRWKAVHGLAALGIEPSRGAVEGLAGDRDFRVRLEAAGALRRPAPGEGD